MEKCVVKNEVFHICIKYNLVQYTAKSKGQKKDIDKYFYEIYKKEKGKHKELISEDVIKSNGVYDKMIKLLVTEKLANNY